MRKNTEATADRTTADLVRAAERGLVVTFSYMKEGASEEELRTLEVTDVMEMGGNLLVTGWCRTRNERRTFRIDRITYYTLHRGHRFTAAHRALLAEEEATRAAEAATEFATYEEEGAWYAAQADRADSRGLTQQAEELWELADLAWELADQR